MNFEDHQNYNCEIETDTDAKYRIYANWLHNNNLDNWQGWKCWAGSTRLHVDKDLKVWSGECCNDYLGEADKDFKVLESTICQQSTCSGCTDDLLTEKHNIL